MTEPLHEIRAARTALTWLIEPGNEAIWRLVQRHGPVAALAGLMDGTLADGALRAAARTRLADADPRQVAALALERAERLGARVLIPEDGEEWPAQVADLTRMARAGATATDRDAFPPLCLWVRGGWPVAEALERSVAVVGSRAATPYGAHIASDLAYGLADRGWTVVSGGAFGVDAAAHRGALAAGGRTVAILACGIDRSYPVGNAALLDRIAETGLVISEWPPGAAPHRHRFLIRNRVIAAATAGTVVVEASERSGALHTLRRAARIGRPAMLVPGPVTSAMSVGCHEFLRDEPAARLVTGVAHVLEEVGRIGADLAPPVRGPERPEDRLDPVLNRILDGVPTRTPAGAEEIAARAGVDLRSAMRALPALVLQGFVRQEPGGLFTLAPRRKRG
ncbi:DNA-processing protein DprA [Rhizomonospora bruguierae]|uniref:DNA-processing protein DprA n=1 Tax=Rhizomonospora bruguierae TaxID=1581705 RepID=UPI001BCFF8B0|nr:DNA-processing protein DprA [Micromonospora sp. NBRC 107566]